MFGPEEMKSLLLEAFDTVDSARGGFAARLDVSKSLVGLFGWWGKAQEFWDVVEGQLDIVLERGAYEGMVARWVEALWHSGSTELGMEALWHSGSEPGPGPEPNPSSVLA